MGKLLLLLLLLPGIGKSYAQNLIANGSFEDRNICLEFHTACAPEAWFRVPLLPVTASMGTAGFFSGNRYESVVMENMQQPLLSRSFIYTRLLCRLDSGKVYQFRSSFRTVDYDFDHVDILMLPFEPNRNKQRLSVTKQKFTITPKQKVQDHPGGWIEYLFAFTATGKERYLVIGNFSKEALWAPQEVPRDPNVLYDIDNISLLPSDTAQKACPEWKANRLKLYQNNSRHTPNNFLDDEDDLKIAEEEPSRLPAAMPKPVINDTLVIPDVLFRFNSSELNPQFANRLDTLVHKIRNKTFKSIEITGHTDSMGTRVFNEALSVHRAETVKKYLIAQLQYAASTIAIRGMAAAMPVASNKTAAGRQKNRRVEIVLLR